jgi:predicted amidophosphoribosyltransferase
MTTAPFCPDCRKPAEHFKEIYDTRDQPGVKAAWYCTDCGIEVNPTQPFVYDDTLGEIESIYMTLTELP